MSMYYDREGNPVPDNEGYLLFDTDRQVADWYSGDVRVSTVYLGLDHGWGGGRPVIFETLVFGGPLEGEMDRYCTEHEALVGHREMVARVKAALALEREMHDG